MSAFIEKTFIERRVFKGAEVRRGYRVKAVKCVRDHFGRDPVEVTDVSSLTEYSSGCSLHRGSCFGHMSRTPTGNLLPPHSLSFRTGDIRTQYYIAASKAFENDSEGYIDALKRTNYGKEGHLRSTMSTPVSGSARLVCIPHVGHDPYLIYMSRNLASKIVFCLPESSAGGSRGARYVERSVVEGDYAMLGRPPSLSKFNNQPLKVKFWNAESMGIHSKVFSFFHGDFDGDEAHVCALGNPRSIMEASMWKVPLDSNLCSAEEYMHKNFPGVCAIVDEGGGMDFMNYTTISFKEVMERKVIPALGNWVRNKESHLRMFAERMHEKKGTSGFLEEAIKGVKDIMRQQITLGKIGDMSRVARIVAMCFSRGERGGTYVLGRKARVLLNSGTEASTGSPSVRCIMVLCQASQEAALHAHRVGSAEATGIDLVCSLLRGRAEGKPGAAQNTLLIFEGLELEKVRKMVSATWCYAAGGEIVVAVGKDDGVRSEHAKYLKGAYSPVALSKVEVKRRREVCSTGVYAVYNYYGLKLEGDDIDDMVEMMIYKVDLSVFPITTREGMISRDLSWVETVMACDYTKLPLVAGSVSHPRSATSATMFSNFSEL